MAGTYPQRRYPRLKDFDYRTPGAYFVTANVHHRRSLLARVTDGAVDLTDSGEIVRRRWLSLPAHYPGVELDEFIVMPDHIHGILFLGERAGHAIPEVVRGFKTFSSRRINEMNGTGGQPFWQRSFYERVIRSEYELNEARKYIRQNPAKWSLRTRHPENRQGDGRDGRV